MSQEENSSGLQHRLGRVPVVGYAFDWGWSLLSLPRKLRFLRTRLEETRTELRETQDALWELRDQFKINGLMADDHDNDEFYIRFENTFRGTEDEIKERLRVYVPYLRKLKLDFSKHPVLDIGCGRGELMDLLHEEQINAIGLDLNESMVARCNERGLTAVQADAFAYLAEQKTGSLGAITGFHIAEHIPFGQLLNLFRECERVLVPGGMVIFETPNPENIDVGSYTFYYDPSHLHPLAPPVLSFALETRGFKVDVLRLHPKLTDEQLAGISDPHVAEVVRRFNTARDFAVLGYKKKKSTKPAK
ncbi:MAG TPA: class I SAM-dependent methyltransferase [Candidatus Saccharimonadales bacterium]|nr:class I SAM-dependent methyltransferase [Candidatus Saccharimonadales bacterium]